MKTTISVIKADVGSIGGHIKPSARLKETVERFVPQTDANFNDIRDLVKTLNIDLSKLNG